MLRLRFEDSEVVNIPVVTVSVVNDRRKSASYRNQSYTVNTLIHCDRELQHG